KARFKEQLAGLEHVGTIYYEISFLIKKFNHNRFLKDTKKMICFHGLFPHRIYRMNITSLFRSTPVTKLPSYTSSEISHSTKKFIHALRGVENTAETKRGKVLNMYHKTENYAKKLEKSVNEGNFNEMLKNARALNKCSKALFYATDSAFTRDAIDAAKVEQSNITSTLLNHKLTLLNHKRSLRGPG
ncbi:hypothetical protein RFD78_004922, partial [Klebsiella aerogenes]